VSTVDKLDPFNAMLVILELFPIKSELITVNPVFQELQIRSRILLLLIAPPALEILLPMNMDKFLAFLVEILLLYLPIRLNATSIAAT